MKRIGYINASPAEFALHRRFGKTLRAGRGLSFFKLPWIDRYYLIPATAQSVCFSADQITAENQGVEVAGFAVWKISDPEKVSATFDFEDSAAALRVIDNNLKNMVESAIRHQVANMTMEDVLRKRGTIILRLKEELAYIAGEWGLVIETVEIKNVHVSSEQLFANMQARFRDEVRLASETSGLETEREISERRFAQREQLALRELEFNRREAERKAELDSLKERQEKELKAQRLALAAELGEIEHANREKEMRLNERLNAVEREAQKERLALETERQQHAAALAVVRDQMERGRIETANLESPALALVENLPAALGALSVKELNLGDNTLRQLAGGMMALAGKETK